MSKTDTPEQLSDNPKKLVNELGDLVDFLADGPEAQQEMRLPQDQIVSGESTSDLDKVPVLTTPVNLEQAVEAGLKFRSELRAEIGPEFHSDLDQLVDELVDQILPKLESELRRRLKTKISESNS